MWRKPEILKPKKQSAKEGSPILSELALPGQPFEGNRETIIMDHDSI
jgi:hypothetical protein